MKKHQMFMKISIEFLNSMEFHETEVDGIPWDSIPWNFMEFGFDREALLMSVITLSANSSVVGQSAFYL
jgi:hypothetical protein